MRDDRTLRRRNAPGLVGGNGTRIVLGALVGLALMAPLAAAADDGVAKSPCQTRWESGQGGTDSDACCHMNVILAYASTYDEPLAAHDLFLAHYSRYLIVAHQCDSVTVHPEESRLRFWSKRGTYDLRVDLVDGSSERHLLANGLPGETNATRWYDDARGAREVAVFHYAGVSASGLSQNYVDVPRARFARANS